MLDRQQGGEAWIIDPDSPTVRMATFTCSHCGSLIHIKTKKLEDIGWLCHGCMKWVCPACATKDTKCDVIERKLDRIEASDRARRSYGF